MNPKKKKRERPISWDTINVDHFRTFDYKSRAIDDADNALAKTYQTIM